MSIYTKREQNAIDRALGIMESKFELEHSGSITSSSSMRHYVQLRIANRLDEVFCAIWLNNQHQVIEFEEMFQGTIDGASVYPRVVVRKALEKNAAAVVFAHNHPSGIPEPSQADMAITSRLQQALATIDVRVLDHLVVGREVVSFAERNLI